ncbi:tetratricopeptide repeat protein [uncultured Desulfovibrio sp.]|uniref:tetratricopeptide repeat protein n=1 Tax=uncultured Desulfovibrio sp. TaxID=167968 RepID=UPI0003A6EC12|nr:tetratricopeptide repeat protein [uncultured Desulfovibrio sp.]
MKQIQQNLDLARGDLMDMESLLCGGLAAFFSFSGHALYFPTHNAPEAPQLLPRERRLLLPLVWREKPLGVLMLHGVRAREVRPLLPALPAVAALCLENLARVRAAHTDAVTGLATEDALFARMEDEAARVRAHLDDPAPPDGRPAPLHRLCMGLVVLRLCNGEDLARQVGFAFGETFLHHVADACRAALPSDVLAARVGRHELALLLSASGRRTCHKLARAALDRMEAVSLPSPLTRQLMLPLLCAGHALYPQDMQGPELVLPMFEQARLLMTRARLAADVAAQGRTSAGVGGESRIMPFARILQDGGVVLERLPLGRLRVSLGRQTKAREGLRFAVRGADGAARGEIVLLQVRELDAVAEILHLEDAARIPEPGDSLALLDGLPALSPPDMESALENAANASVSGLPGGAPQAAVEHDAPKESPARIPSPAAEEERGSRRDHSGLYGHGDFLNRFSREREQCAHFTLSIVRLVQGNGDGRGSAREPEHGMRRVLDLWRALSIPVRAQSAPPEAGDVDAFGGRYGSNSLIFFHPGHAAENLLPVYAQLCAGLKKYGMEAAAGLAGYPFLQFRKAEMQDCALKALEYALLLPEPKAGVCNSLALNISADRRYSLGDVFGAVEEYKLALLADETNVMAWNSLGVCMAALGRQHEARRHFLEALKQSPDDARAAQICYNLGTVCQNLGERRAAARYYRQCVKIAPDHLFAHIRLGQLCEQGGRRGEARRFYEQAAAIEDARPGAPSLARRHLARVAACQRRGGEARELLHEALLRNPNDAAAMLLLAKIYLDGNEDPAMAELLARKSVGLHDRPEAWQTLARALRALAREEDARVADARALLA